MSRRFSQQAELYARYRPHYPQEMYDFIFEHLSSRRWAWDCATGSGQVARYLSRHFGKVIATDISEEQLRHAPQLSNVRYQKAFAGDSGLPDNHFDLITVAQAIHWFDFEQFYREVRRVAKDDALLAVIGYGMVRVNDKINPIIDELYEKAFGAYFNENRKYLDEEYRTIPFPFDEISSPSFSHTLNWKPEELKGYFNSWSAIQKIKSADGYNPADKTMQQLKEKNIPESLEVTFPVFMRLGRIKR